MSRSVGFDDRADFNSFTSVNSTVSINGRGTAFPSVNHQNNHNNHSNGNGNGNTKLPKHLINPHPTNSITEFLDSYFSISARGSSINTEIRSGFVTFFTMAYILIVNAEVLSKSGPDSTGQHMSFEGIATATALTAAIGSSTVGILGNLPFGLAPGMGLNSYFTYGVCLRSGLDWHIALTCVFIQGILFMILSLAGACNLIQLYAPPCIKKSITVGLGLFQALIGFECMKLVVSGSDVLLQLGNVSDPRIWLASAGLLAVCLMLLLDIKAAMLIGMVLITVIAWVTGLSPYPTELMQFPSLDNTLLALDFNGYFTNYSITIPVTLMFLFVSIFDTAGVQFMAGQQAGLLDESDHLPGAKAAFFSAGLATSIGALLGTSPVIIHNETCAGIQDGARTGLHSVIVALLFIFSLPFIPILRAVPPFATAPPLIIVGMFMMMAAKFIEWERVDEAMPAFLTATILPLTYSIANGMIAGIVAFIVLKLGAYAGGRLTGTAALVNAVTEGNIPTGMDNNSKSPYYSSIMSNNEDLPLDSRVLYNSRGPLMSPGSIAANPLATGLVSFDDPMPGSPAPPYIDRKPSIIRSFSLTGNSTGATNPAVSGENSANRSPLLGSSYTRRSAGLGIGPPVPLPQSTHRQSNATNTNPPQPNVSYGTYPQL